MELLRVVDDFRIRTYQKTLVAPITLLATHALTNKSALVAVVNL
jgi:hypothetical protein